MANRIKLMLVALLYFVFSYAETPSVFIQSINVITGQTKEDAQSKKFQYDYYVEGQNDVGGTAVKLAKGDWRIGRVKAQKQWDDHTESFQTIQYLFYYPEYTESLSLLGHKNVYRYNKKELIEAVEQYIPSGAGYALYRKERLFWDSSSRLVSRVLEDGQGVADICYYFEYNNKGQLIKETVFGNLSGLCTTPLVVDVNGKPQENGIESYATAYEFADGLLIGERSDNGSCTLYHYDPKTKQCLSKMRRDSQRIFSRQFYAYDALGLLSRVVIDDGMGKSEKDLKGVTTRKILLIQSCLAEAAFGQPALTENKYWDLATQQEVLLEKELSTYSEKGELVQKDFYDANGALRYYLKMSYDEQGELISTIDSRGETTERPEDKTHSVYDVFGHCTAFSDEYGNTTHYQYDAFGRLLKTTHPLVLDAHDQPVQYQLIQAYDIRNRVVSSQDANGNLTRTTYNARGKPIKVVYADGSYESFVYFLDGQLKEYQGKDGRKIVYQRDAFGRVLRSEEYTPGNELIASLAYTYKGTSLSALTDGKSFTTTFSYDGAGRQIGVKHETKDGIKRREWVYDACGNKSAMTEWFGPNEADCITKVEEKDAKEQTVAVRFQDANGQVQRQMSLPQDQTETFVSTQDGSTKNDRGQYVRQQDAVDVNGTRHIYTYDAMGRLETWLVLDCFGNKASEKHFRYDGNGNKILEKNIVLLQGQATRTYTITWHYDALNRLIDIWEGLESSAPKHVHYHYNHKGQLEAVTKPDGIRLIYQYDSRGRPIQFVSSDGSFHYQYAYDALHRLTTAEDLTHAHHTIHRRYNDFNELIEENLGNQLALKNTYDLAGRRTSLTLPDQSSVLYIYAGTALASIQRLNPEGKPLYRHGYTYDIEPGQLVQSHLIGDCGFVLYTYDSRQRPSKIQSPFWTETIPEDGFDCYHHVKRMVIEDPAGQVPYSFNYTASQQLCGEEGHEAQTYQHDSLYNRVSQNQVDWSVNELNQILKTGNAEYRYDINGNLIEKTEGSDKWTFAYDGLNRLIRATKNQASACAYYYDAFHRRLAQIHEQWDAEKQAWQRQETEYFLYDGDKEIGKSDSQGNLVELRILGTGKGGEIGAAIALELQGRVYAPIHDHQGSVRCLIDLQTKQPAEFYRYTAFGVEEIFNENGQPTANSAVGNPWRFSSKRHDALSGWQFFGRRYYDPSLARWTTPDPLFFYDASNLYAFVRNDPLTRCDPSGMFSISSIWSQIKSALWKYWVHIQNKSNTLHKDLASELSLPEEVTAAFERVGKQVLGESTILLLGYQCDGAEINVYGKHELNNRVRVTFINGILTTKDTIIDNLELISQSHGGVNVHYIFRATEGWTRDISQGFLIKVMYYLGFRSSYTYLLAETWKRLIQEMGGVNGGGIIIHYAHSLGGTETDRARDLLTPEEQKMIRVITLGSSTLVRNEGFASVVNYVSRADGVSSCVLEPFGHIRNYFDSNTNVIFRGNFFQWPCFPLDHLLNGKTYQPIIIQLGEQFLLEFATNP